MGACQQTVIQTVRERFSCRACESVTQAPAPFHAVPRGWAGPSLLAMVLFEKFGQHVPLNRQAERYAREGVPLSLSTLADQVGTCAGVLEPLFRLIERHVMAAGRLHGDDTTVPVLAKGKTSTGRVWVYVRDDRPFGGGDPPAALFHFSPDRRGEHPQAHLANWTGVLQADAYGGYGKLYGGERKPAPIIEAACWAHARRKFFELADIEGAARQRAQKKVAVIAPLALEAVRRMDELFAIEREVNGRSVAERLAMRRERSVPIVAALEGWMRAERARLPGAAPVAKAMNYMLDRWPSFARFLDDGRVCLSNNAAERALRGLATAVSLCIPLSSVCKHWKRARILDATRATFPGHRAPDRLRRQIGCPDLMGGARNNLNRRQHASFDEAPYRVVRDARNPRRLGHREPFPILFRRSVSMDAAHASDGGDPVRRPGFTLSSRQAHPVERRGDMLVRPAARHAPHDRQGILGRRATVFPASRLVHAQLRVLAATPVDREHDVTHCLVDVDHDVGDQCPQELLPSPRRHTRRLPCRRQVVGQGGEDVQIGHAVR